MVMKSIRPLSDFQPAVTRAPSPVQGQTACVLVVRADREEHRETALLFLLQIREEQLEQADRDRLEAIIVHPERASQSGH